MPILKRFDPLNPASYFTGGYRNEGFENFNQTDPVFVDPSVKYIRERKPILAGLLMATTGLGAIPAYRYPQASPTIGAVSAGATGALLAAIKATRMRKGNAALLGALLGGFYGHGVGSLARSIYRRQNPELIEAQEKGIPYNVVK